MADNRIAYGLAKKYGIDTKGMSPKEVWGALKEKGISQDNAEEKYSESNATPAEKKRLQELGFDTRKENDDKLTAEERRLKKLGFESKKNKVQDRHILETIPKEKRTQYIQDELNVSLQKAKEYSEALYFYTDDFDHVKDIRAYQRGESVKSVSEIERQEQALEEYIVKAPKWNGGETFRGVKLIKSELDQYSVGSEHNMLGTSSWSSNEDVAIGYAGYGLSPSGKESVVFHSLTQKNGTSVRHLSPFDNEDEILVSKESRYRVIKTEKKKDGISHIYLEEL